MKELLTVIRSSVEVTSPTKSISEHLPQNVGTNFN
jgi:hypothetical protein